MDEARLIKLSKQIRLLNVLLVLVGLVFALGFALTALVGYLAVQEIKDTKNTLQSVQTQIKTSGGSVTDLQKELCSSSGSLQMLLNTQTTVCDR